MVLPEEFLNRMKYLPDFDEFVLSYDKAPESGMRINKRKLKSFSGKMRLGERVPWCENGYYADKSVYSGAHPYHMSGLIYFQEPSAMCAAELFDMQSGDYVLDLCAAPGGKSTQLADDEDIVLVSNEIIPKRCSVLSENIERMGYDNVLVTNESPERLESIFGGFFDKIIIDAPCSGEGMFKKEPAAVEAWSTEHVKSCSARQKKIIDSAMKMLSQGGEIVYSTCTFSHEENEENAEYITEKYPYMTVVKSTRIYPHRERGEGHYAVLLKDVRDKVNVQRSVYKQSKASADCEKLYREFEKKALNCTLSGDFVMFGENLYLKKKYLPVDKLKIARVGLHLGVCKKGRFEPAHALARYLRKDDFKNFAEFECDDINIKKYLHGDVISGDFSGWGAVICDGLTVGWVKGSGGMLKNHFPKKLRLI